MTVEICFPSDHPTAAGHFPSDPMIPGALLLDAVVAAIAGSEPVMMRAAKFLRPVRPGERVTLSWQAVGGVIKFECRNETLAMTGTLEIVIT